MVSKVIEMSEGNHKVKFLMKIVLYSSSMKHLLSCYIYVYEPMTASVSRLSSVQGGGEGSGLYDDG